MLLERNGQQLSTKRTKHRDIQYFYVGDHIQNKTLSLKHCPTEEILADYFTKPLQGSLFLRLHNHIMGAEFEDGDPQTHRSVLEYQDHHEHDTNMEASKRDLEASEWDQNEMKNNKKKFPPQDDNNKNACDTNMHHGEHARKKEK